MLLNALLVAERSHLLPSSVAACAAVCRAHRSSLQPRLAARRADLSGGAELYPVQFLGAVGSTEQPDFLYLRHSVSPGHSCNICFQMWGSVLKPNASTPHTNVDTRFVLRKPTGKNKTHESPPSIRRIERKHAHT